jgi:putative intracellular protease/amidase
VVDDDVVRDEYLVTSRQPSDIPAFNRTILALLAESREPYGRGIQPGEGAPTLH